MKDAEFKLHSQSHLSDGKATFLSISSIILSYISYCHIFHIFVQILRIITSFNDGKRDGKCRVGGKLGVMSDLILSKLMKKYPSVKWVLPEKSKVASPKFFSLFLSVARLIRLTLLEPSMKPHESIPVWLEPFYLV